ncbi:MAG TPA: hypothetical protein VF824_10615 [Thermoanaerobaculia bacterium]
MSWFHYTKHERLQRRRQVRLETAERAIKEASSNWYMVPGIVEPCIGDALEEAYLFEEYFGEPMPTHLRHALQVEVELWQRLILAIKNAKNITEEEYVKYLPRVRAYLVAVIDLLQAEQEMITSCLVRYYEHIVATSRDAALRSGL